MGVTVEVQGALLTHTKGRSEIEVEGATVGEVLATIRNEHPDLYAEISDPTRVQLFINGDVQIKPGVDNQVRTPDGTRFVLVKNIAGG